MMRFQRVKLTNNAGFGISGAAVHTANIAVVGVVYPMS